MDALAQKREQGSADCAADRSLVIRNLSKQYRTSAIVLKNVSFALAGRGVTAIIGPSGAGKSTLVRCINRLVDPTAGEILFMGQDLAKLGGRALRRARRRIGMVFQEYNLVERLSVIENVLCGRLGYVPVWRAFLRRFRPEDVDRAFQLLDAVGLREFATEQPRQIIGIVADTREHDLSDAAQPTVIIPLAQEPNGMTRLGLQFGPIFWLIRTGLEPHQVAVKVSEQLREASGGLPAGRVRTMDEVLSNSIARQDFNMLLLGVFAMAALALTAVGIYGVMAYSVAQRTHEIGVRMALGADRARIRNLVVGKGMLTAGLGVIVGLAAAAFLARFLAGFLFGVRAWDPMVFIAVPVLLALVALFALWIPARRAARLEPIQALRVE